MNTVISMNHSARYQMDAAPDADRVEIAAELNMKALELIAAGWLEKRHYLSLADLRKAVESAIVKMQDAERVHDLVVAAEANDRGKIMIDALYPECRADTPRAGELVNGRYACLTACPLKDPVALTNFAHELDDRETEATRKADYPV